MSTELVHDTNGQGKLLVELYERIIDHLAGIYTVWNSNYDDSMDYRRDLRSCALVCRAWLDRSRVHLFSIVHVEGTKLRSFERTIRISPTISPFVQNFDFWNTYLDETAHTPADKTSETMSHAIRVAEKLKNIWKLNVGHINMNSEHPRLPELIRALGSASKLSVVSVYSTTPTRLTQLLRVVTAFHRARLLKFRVPIITPSYPIRHRPYLADGSLLALQLSIEQGTSHFLEWLINRRTFTSKLRAIEIDLTTPLPSSEIHSSLALLSQLLEDCGDHIEEFTFGADVTVKESKNLPFSKPPLSP